MRKPMPAIVLKKDRESSVHRRHPWIFSGSVAKVQGSPESGESVDVLDAGGKFCGRGAFSPKSKIIVRFWTFEDEEISVDFFRSRIERAVSCRRSVHDFTEENACRLIHAESDGLPGVIADRYGEYVVCQFLTAGSEKWKETLADILMEAVACKGVFERSDVDVRVKEGLEKRCGSVRGEDPPETIQILEDSRRYWVDVRKGHKTGFYLDQSRNRGLVGLAVSGREVLDCFAYTGGFAVAALGGGAESVTVLESSREGLQMAGRNLELNGFENAVLEEGDVFERLRKYRDSGKKFDALILDPPKFATSRQDLERACRGYKDINLLAFKLLRSGGILATFSCSQLVSPELFQKAVAYAAMDAGRDVQIMEWLYQAQDHPVTLAFPESLYLKGLLCRIW